ncbi:MAG: hypothetical protein WDN06_00865 [Asticcacaulis sp.]
MQRAVSEVYRFVRDGHKVVAVVSAFKGQTDQLLRLAGSYTQASSSSATPHLVATGRNARRHPAGHGVRAVRAGDALPFGL